MRHILVESNWVFDCCAPEFLVGQAARSLLKAVHGGEVRLYLPSICLREAAAAIRKKVKPRFSKEISDFRKWAAKQELLSVDDSQAVLRFQEVYQRAINHELVKLDDAIDELTRTPGLEVFALDDDMLERCISLRTELHIPLRPFDESILAGVLVRGARLHRESGEPILFCTLDAHLQPWDKSRNPISELQGLYEDAGIKVRGDFLLNLPAS